MKEYKTITSVTGPLIFLEKTESIGYGEHVTITLPSGEVKRGQVLDTSRDTVVVQVFEGTRNIDKNTFVKFSGDVLRAPVSNDMLGRIFSGSGDPLDGGPKVIPEARLDINGLPINPYKRAPPQEFIQTGVSAIDGMNSLIRGQKLPIFSGSGLPHNQLALQIARQATVLDCKESFAVIFVGMGITEEEAKYFISDFEKTGALERGIVFLNLASDPSIERLIVPRIALTTAEFLAFNYNMHMLVIMTDMTNYCEALREIGSAREEVPGRRGYPGYMYTDLASIYERAGRIQGKNGSITQVPILTMPGDDITHPIPDLSGYITEGQIIVSRDLQRKGIYPPIDVLPSLSRLMSKGIGKDRTREDHKSVSDQLYAAYAEGKDLRGLVSIVGKESLSKSDKLFLEFADDFERMFVAQNSNENRKIETTLDIAWEILSKLPEDRLLRVSDELIEKYMRRFKNASNKADEI